MGKAVRDLQNGGETDYVPLDDFRYNLLISGGTRIERSIFLSKILNQVYEKVSDLGVLLIKLQSNEDRYLYHLDAVYEFGDPDLSIPYFIGNKFDELHLEQFIKIMNAIFGFHYEMKYVIWILFLKYRKSRFPSSIMDFLADLKAFMVENPYNEEFNNSCIRSIEEAIRLFENDPILERILWIPLSDNIQWFERWNRGEKICIDLTQCSTHYQKTLVSLIQQAITNLLPESNSSFPSGIVVLDGSDSLLKTPPHEFYKRRFSANKAYISELKKESYFLTKEQIEEIAGDTDYLTTYQIEENFIHALRGKFRYNNVSLITVCQDPSRIYPLLLSMSQIKINLDSQNTHRRTVWQL